VAQLQEQLFSQCSQWTQQQPELRKMVGQTMGWKAGWCRPVQISELFSMEICDKVMDFLAAMDVGKFLPMRCMDFGAASLFHFFCQRGRRVLDGSSAI